jgi:uncharacterized protein (TIGR03545 family)
MSKKIKIHPVFRKKYTEKQYRKKILNKLFVPADTKLVESLFTSELDPKKGTVYTIRAESVSTPGTAKNLARIAKEIKKQKGRFNLTAIVAALLCVVALGLVLTVFRNQIARVALTSAMEGAFGARCEIGSIDFNLLDTRFRVDNLSVANRKSPMKNLFSIGKAELFFDLLELTRGKLVANNVEITGITWNTDRKVSGALPPAKQKVFDKKQAVNAKTAKPDPVTGAILSEVDKLKAGISIDAGVSSIKDQLDPVKYLENEKKALLLPAVVDSISATVPALSTSWQTKNTEVRQQVDKTISDGKNIQSLDVGSIRTVAEAQVALKEINDAIS